jgi:ribose-phosphate pyrophosphokinase
MKTNTDCENYILAIENPRFNNGESKVIIKESVRCKDVYILVDIGNYGCTYKMFGHENIYSPDEHFQDLKRAISAIKNTADRVTVIMPLLYASRQHKRKSRESLDCAMALQELQALGIKNIITFDAHDPNVQNAIPNLSFENFYASNVIIETFIKENKINLNKFLVISPDTGAMDRALYYANILGADVGMFYKRRDVSKVVDGKNPVVAHEYMGKDIKGLDVVVVDDMIASGDSILEVSEKLKENGANNIYILSTFALFTQGTDAFEEAYKNNLFNKIYSTNLSYIPDKVKNFEWFGEVDCSKFMATIINTLNSNESISHLLKGNENLISLINEKKKKI